MIEDILDQVEIKIVRHVHFFNDEISPESVQGLINELNNYNEIDLFFATNGGDRCAIEVLIHYLNSRKEEITIYLTGEICSAGTYLLTDFQGELKISENLDFILFHLIDRYMSVSKKGEISKIELKKQLKELNVKDTNKFKKLGLTDKEIKRYTAGYDIILYQKDFHRLNINQK